MNTFFDHIASTVVLGVVVLVILVLNGNFINTFFQRNLDITAQDAAIGLFEILESDFNRIGYMVDSSAISVAREDGLVFQGDVDGDGNPELVSYQVGNSTQLSTTENPHDLPLFRKVGTAAEQNVAAGLVRFSLTFRDAFRTILPYDSLSKQEVRTRIRFIDVDVRIEPPVLVDSTFAPVELVRTVAPRNIEGW